MNTLFKNMNKTEIKSVDKLKHNLTSMERMQLMHGYHIVSVMSLIIK